MTLGRRLEFGHARAEITPPLGAPMGGYAARGARGCDAVESPLYADVLCLRQGERTALFILCDLIAIDEGWGRGIRSALSSELDLPQQHIVMLASHTHFGPETRRGAAANPLQEQWLAATAGAIVATAHKAAASLRSARLRFGCQDVAPMMYNRRLRRPDGQCETVFRLPLPAPDLRFGPVDPRLSVLRFDDDAGRPLLFLASVGIHPVIGGENFYGISPDYPGVMRSALEAVYGVPFLFALGTAGNVVPSARGPGQRERIGRYLAGAALEAAETAEPIDPDLVVAGARVELPAGERLSEGAMAARIQAAQNRLEAAKGAARGVVRAESELRRLEGLARATARYGIGATLPFECTAIGLGQVGIVCLPGEIFAETGLQLQVRSPFPQTVIFSLANKSTGYLATRSALWEGGYEADVTLMGEASEAEAVELATRLLLEARAGSPQA